MRLLTKKGGIDDEYFDLIISTLKIDSQHDDCNVIQKWEVLKKYVGSGIEDFDIVISNLNMEYILYCLNNMMTF